ncbi:MAG: MoaD/ThiS family protein [Thermodesulfobacteriota bacterium]|nr:MoaD/ThiS family protein [Thermodesulfobacteriota bacterium]
MEIELKLYASLAHHMPDGMGSERCMVEIREGTRIRELLTHLDVPVNAVKLIFLNGIHAAVDEILKEGDRLGVFPPVAGG